MARVAGDLFELKNKGHKVINQRIGNCIIGSYVKGHKYAIGVVLVVSGDYFYNVLSTDIYSCLDVAKASCLSTVKGNVPYIKNHNNDLFIFHRRFNVWLKNPNLDKYFKNNEF